MSLSSKPVMVTGFDVFYSDHLEHFKLVFPNKGSYAFKKILQKKWEELNIRWNEISQDDKASYEARAIEMNMDYPERVKAYYNHRRSVTIERKKRELRDLQRQIEKKEKEIASLESIEVDDDSDYD